MITYATYFDNNDKHYAVAINKRIEEIEYDECKTLYKPSDDAILSGYIEGKYVKTYDEDGGNKYLLTYGGVYHEAGIVLISANSEQEAINKFNNIFAEDLDKRKGKYIILNSYIYEVVTR